jgi:hypothetical protein
MRDKMETEQLSKIRILLNEFKKLQPVKAAEPTIFSIGTKGYYENPTTDILSFFCDTTNNAHTLDALVLQALVECLPDEYQYIDCSLINPPEREVVTLSGKRIDLLLEGSDWVIVLENKIFHQQNNPFDHYEAFIEKNDNKKRFSGKQVIYVVLSPTGEVVPDKWCGINYSQLIASIKPRLADHFISHPLSKWTVLLREFLLHLEGFMSNSSMPEQSIQFVLSHLTEIKELQELKQNAVNTFHRQLQEALAIKLNRSVNIHLHHWNGMPALRFSISDWRNTESDVVLYFSDEQDVPEIIFYAHLSDNNKPDTADLFIDQKNCFKSWLESGGKYRGYKEQPKRFDFSYIVERIADRLLQLNEFECAVRPYVEEN